jgi:hypothetical protein
MEIVIGLCAALLLATAVLSVGRPTVLQIRKLLWIVTGYAVMLLLIAGAVNGALYARDRYTEWKARRKLEAYAEKVRKAADKAEDDARFRADIDLELRRRQAEPAGSSAVPPTEGVAPIVRTCGGGNCAQVYRDGHVVNCPGCTTTHGTH